jgi:hypothetical protein
MSEDVLYVGSSYQKVLYAFNPDQPEMLWQTDVNGLNYGYPAVHDDFVIVGTGNTGGIQSGGSITILNKHSHEVIGRYDVPAWVETPLYHEGIIYFGCSDHNVYAINENKLLNLPYPESFIKDTDTINLGELENKGSISASYYIHNNGNGMDSLTYKSAHNYITAEPETVILEPTDSVEISVTIDLTGLSAGDRNIYIRYKSNKSLDSKLVLKKAIAFHIIDVSHAESNREYTSFFLGQPYPNPSADIVKLDYMLKKPGHINVRLINSNGKEILHLINSFRPGGANTLNIDTSHLKNGIYLLICSTDDTIQTRKILIMNEE